MPRKTRQRASWGSNEAAGPGKRRIRYWADKHDGRGYRRCSETVEGTRKDADRRLAELRLVHDADAPVPTVGDAYRAWWLPDAEMRLAEYERENRPAGHQGELMKPGTMRTYTSAWRNHVAPRWDGVQVTDVRYAAVQEWLGGMRGQAASKSLALLRQVLRMCLLNEVLTHNVCDESFRLKPALSRQNGGNLTLDELVNRLWPEVAGTFLEAPFIMGAFASARPGESLGPKIAEVEAVESHGMTVAVVPIIRQVRNNGDVTEDGDMKNGQSERVAVIPEPFSTRLLMIAERGREEGYAYLCDDGTGNPVSMRAVRSEFLRAVVRAGLPECQFRSLRRSWRTWSATTGIPAEVLEKMMGHVGYGVTGRHYLDPSTGQLVETVARAFSENPIKINWDILGQNESMQAV